MTRIPTMYAHQRALDALRDRFDIEQYGELDYGDDGRYPLFALRSRNWDEALPVATVSRDAGEWLHWSGDSKKLHWSLGPELFTRELGHQLGQRLPDQRLARMLHQLAIGVVDFENHRIRDS